jgi:hypothetical protein
MGAPVVDTIPMGFPISLRKPGDPEGGNRIAAARSRVRWRSGTR